MAKFFSILIVLFLFAEESFSAPDKPRYNIRREKTSQTKLNTILVPENWKAEKEANRKTKKHSKLHSLVEAQNYYGIN